MGNGWRRVSGRARETAQPETIRDPVMTIAAMALYLMEAALRAECSAIHMPSRRIKNRKFVGR
jgi:hypothetical protein